MGIPVAARTAICAVLAAFAGALCALALAAERADAAGGAYSLKWAAADPAKNSGPYQPTYDKETPPERACPAPSGGTGRSGDPIGDAVSYSPGGAADSVSSMAPKDMALGQIVPFQLEVTVGAGANGDLEVNPYFLAKTTNGGNFGYDPAYGVLCAFVDTADKGTTDPAANAKVSSFSSSILQPGTSNERIAGKINLAGLNAGDKVIVEIWVVLKDKIPTGSTGNVQTGITSAREPSSGDTVNVGNQTVPLLRVQEFFDSEADLSVTKSDSPDPASRGGQLTYTLSVTNNSTTTTANGVVVTDTLDPNTTFVSASGASCSVASGVVTCQAGFLGPGETKQVTITTLVSATAPAGNDAGTGAAAGSVGTSCPAATTDLCNRVSVTSTVSKDPVVTNNAYVQPTNVVRREPAVTQEKLVTDLNGGEALPGDILEYTIYTSNSDAPGTDAATGLVVRDAIPNDTAYVLGSITTSSSARTDAAGDDVAEYDSAQDRVVARLGTGATSSAGGRLGPGETVALTFRVTVGSPLPDDRLVKNTATASFFSESEGTPGSVTSNAQIQVGAPDLTIAKTRTSGPIVAGQDIDYEIEVENVGDATTVGTVTVSDTLPQGLTVDTVSGTGWTCSITPPTPSRDFTCTRSQGLAPGNAYPVISLRADTDPGLTGAVTNTASVSGGSDINYENNSGTDTTNTGHAADLVVTKSAAPGTIEVGDTSTFTITVRNNGPSTATGIGLDDPIPTGLEQVGNASPSQGTCVAGLVVCDLGSLAPNATATVTVTVRATSAAAGKTITNIATAQSSGAPDPTPGNNIDDADVVVRGVDLKISKSLQPTPPVGGNPVTFELVVTNDGPSDATGVVVRDSLPSSVTGPSVTDGGGADCAIASGELVCDVGNLPAGSSITIEVGGTLASNATLVSNTASVSGAETDEDPSDNTDTVEEPVDPRADLSLVKSASPASVPVGDEVTYALTATNDGPHTAVDVVISDVLPSGVTYIAGSSGCSEAGGTVTCELGDLQSGQSASVVIRVRVDSGPPRSLANTAEVDSDTTDPDPSDNDAGETVTVTDPPSPPPPVGPATNADLEITKTANKADASPGELVTYTFSVKNNGPNVAHHVTVRDPLSPYLQYVSGPAGCTYANFEVVCDMGDLNPGQSASKSVVLRLDPAYSPSSPPTAHDIDVQKVERFVSVQAGQYAQETLSCPSGYVMTDANPRVTGVDQGNDPADVHVVGSRTGPGNAGADVASYRFDVENHTSGQAQVHLFGVCVSLQAQGNGGHTLGPAGLRTAAIDATDLGTETRVSETITCPNSSDVAVAPGYVFRTGANYVHGPSMVSERSADGRSWTFAFDVAPKSAAQNDVHIDLSVRCMPRTTSQNSGHGHALIFHHVYGHVAVGARSTSEHRLSCPVGFKGITATYDLPAGLKLLGTTPEPINRDFKLHNTTDETLHANIDLLCLKTRIGDGLNGDEPDWNAGNDFSSWVLHDPPAQGGGDLGGTGTGSGSGAAGGGSTGGGSDQPGTGNGSASEPGDAAGDQGKLTLRLGNSVTHSGRTAMVPVFGGDDPSEGTVRLDAGRNHLGTARFELDAGEDAFVDVRLSKKGRRLLGNRRFVIVTLESGDTETKQTLRVSH
jgi:uncharacterized repeat protein (TIGR01451 family)